MLIAVNGVIQDESQWQFDLKSNRAFHYGDGFFESIRFCNNQIPFFHFHLERMGKAFDALELPGFLPEPHFLEAQIRNLFAANKIEEGVARLTYYRKAEGRYSPSNESAEYIIEVTPRSFEGFVHEYQAVGITQKAFLHPQPYSFAKTLNALPYVMAAKDAQRNGWNEAILCSSNQELVEGTFSNLVVVFGSELKTPAPSTGAVEGTGLRALQEVLQAMGKTIEFTHLPAESLYDATEIWFVNAANGIHAALKFENRTYQNELAKEVGKFMHKHFITKH